MSEYEAVGDSHLNAKVTSNSSNPCGARYAGESRLAIACQKVIINYKPEDIASLLRIKTPPEELQTIFLRAYYFKVETPFRSEKYRPYLDAFRKNLCKKAMLDPMLYEFINYHLINDGQRSIDRFVQKLTNVYSNTIRDLIYEAENDLVIEKKLCHEFVHFIDSYLLDGTIPGYKKLKKNPEKLTKKFMFDSLIFSFFGTMQQRRASDIAFNSIIREIKKCRKWKSFVFNLKDSHIISDNIKKEFLGFFEQSGKSEGRIKSKDLPPKGDNTRKIREPKKRRTRKDKNVAKPPEFFELED